MTQAKAHYARILVKLSGEALMGGGDYGIDPVVIKRIAGELQDIVHMGVQVATVIGGGNIFRGAGLARAGMDRVAADHMGMLATVMNALAMQDALEGLGMPTRVMSAIRINEVCEDYIRRRAVRHLEKGRIVIFAAGTGNPFFTTDTAAALRAAEVHAEVVLMAKNGIEGVYTADPAHDPDAEFIPEITHKDALTRGLQVMDSTAFALCMDNNLPIVVFNMSGGANIDKIVSGDRVGTLVRT